MKKPTSIEETQQLRRQDIRAMRFLFGAFLIVGITMCAIGLKKRYQHRPSLQWPEISGQVIASEWQRGRKDSYYARVGYSYQIAGEQYVSYQVSLWNPLFHGMEKEVADFSATHAVNQPVKVFYNPKQPAEAVLIPGDRTNSNLALICGGLFAAVLSGRILLRPRKQLEDELAKG